jgi:hypothetical protein
VQPLPRSGVFESDSLRGAIIVWLPLQWWEPRWERYPKLGWLIGWSTGDMWADSLYFLYVLFGSICKTFSSFQHILWPTTYARWANFDLSSVGLVPFLRNLIPLSPTKSNLILLFLLLLDGLGPLACSPSEIIWNYKSCRQLVGLRGWVIRTSQGPSYTGQYKYGMKADKYPYLNWDYNPWS